MRAIGLPLVVATMAAAMACNSDRASAPTTGQSGQLAGLPPELIATHYTYLKLPGPGFVTVRALNDSGDVVGGDGSHDGVLWHGAAHERTSLPIHPEAIANDGTIAGYLDEHAATWKNGRVTILDTAVSQAFGICKCESPTVVGTVTVNGVPHAAIWVNGIRIDAGLPPNSNSAAFRAIANGFIVGNAVFPVPNPHPGVPGDQPTYNEPYSWSHSGGWVRLRRGPVSDVYIASVNSHGIAVGWSRNDGPVYFDVGAGTGEERFSANPFFPTMIPSGINDSGRVSGKGNYVRPDGSSNGSDLPLVGSTSTGMVAVLPPGGPPESWAAGINSAGMIAGNLSFDAALWIPNP